MTRMSHVVIHLRRLPTNPVRTEDGQDPKCSGASLPYLDHEKVQIRTGPSVRPTSSLGAREFMLETFVPYLASLLFVPCQHRALQSSELKTVRTRRLHARKSAYRAWRMGLAGDLPKSRPYRSYTSIPCSLLSTRLMSSRVCPTQARTVAPQGWTPHQDSVVQDTTAAAVPRRQTPTAFRLPDTREIRAWTAATRRSTTAALPVTTVPLVR